MYTNLGGINVKLSDYMTQENQVLNLRNYTFEKAGAWSTRPGYTGFQTLVNGSFAPFSIYEYIYNPFTAMDLNLTFSPVSYPGSTMYIYDSGTTLYKLQPTPGAITNGLGPGSTGVGPIDYLVFNNILYFANGYAFKKYDGLSTSYSYGLPGFRTGDFPPAGFNPDFPVTSATFTTSLPTGVFGNTYVQGQYVFRLGFVRPVLQEYAPPDYLFGPGSANLNLSLFQFGPPTGPTITIGVTPTKLGSFEIFLGPTIPFAQNPYYIQYGATTSYPFVLYQQYPGELEPKLMNLWILYGPTFINGMTQYFIATDGQGAQRFDFFPDTSFLTLVPRYIETYNNMLFMSGFSTAPSTVWHSDVNDADQVESDFFFEIRTAGNGEVITAMKTFQGSLVIFKQNSVHELTGDSPDTLSLKDVNLEYGCLSNQGVVAFQNKLWFMDSKGIVEYSGNNVGLISEKVLIYLNNCNKLTARFYHLKKYNQVWCLAQDNTNLKYKAFVYDYLLDAWTIYDDFDAIGGSNLFNNGREEKELHFYGRNASLQPKFFAFNSSLFSDDGFGITQTIQTKFHKRLGDSTQELWRRFFLNNSVEGSTLGITLNFIPDYGTNVSLTRTMGMTMFQSRIDYGLSAKSMSVEILAKSTTRIQVNGYTIESRYLRPV